MVFLTTFAIVMTQTMQMNRIMQRKKKKNMFRNRDFVKHFNLTNLSLQSDDLSFHINSVMTQIISSYATMFSIEKSHAKKETDIEKYS